MRELHRYFIGCLELFSREFVLPALFLFFSQFFQDFSLFCGLGEGGTGSIERPPPLIGEHTDEILQEAGYDSTEIAAFRAEGVV